MTYTVHYWSEPRRDWVKSQTIHSADSIEQAAAVIGSGFTPYFGSATQWHRQAGTLHMLVSAA